MTATLLTIGQLADRAGLRTSALRYYEQLGLLSPACRVGGKRRFRIDTLDRLAVIEFAKALGFSLDEIKTLVEAGEGSDRANRTLRELALVRLPEVDRQLEQLNLMREMLVAAKTCACSSLVVCARAVRRRRLARGDRAGS